MSQCSDDVIWEVINRQFCTYKVTTPTGEVFCKHPYNVNGVCSRLTCPLANSQYATVRNMDGKFYLCLKTAERQHTPAKWWEHIELSNNYDEAIKQIEDKLLYWPERFHDWCKQRLSRLFEVKLTERRLALTQDERHYTVRSSKVKRRESSRERKALVAAKLERAIERELLDRLKSGAYGEQPLNVDETVWQKIMSGLKNKHELEDDVADQMEAHGEMEFVEDEDDDELVDVEDMEKWLDQSDDDKNDKFTSDSDDSSDDDQQGKKKKAVPRKRVKANKRGGVEYEEEVEQENQTTRA